MRSYNSLTAFFLASLLSVCFAADAASAQTAPNATVASVNAVDIKNNDERYRIGYQDVLTVAVFTPRPQAPETVSVAPDGTIRLSRLPEYPITVVCKTEQELAKEITALLKQHVYVNPFVSVRAVEQRSQSFAVIGAVVKPGSFYLTRKIRLLELLSFAGGPDTEKAGTKMIVARTGSNSVCREDARDSNQTADEQLELYQYNVKDVLQGKENLWMQPGDIVSVLDADLVYVYGNVNKQGSIKLTRPLTLRQAISEAEGFAPASKKDKIRVIRQKDGSTDWEEIVFNLKDIESGKVKDPFLMPNDIVAVSEDPVKSLLNKIKNSVTGGLGNLPIYIR
jgi:polysaccharide biosynthesis/export protein